MNKTNVTLRNLVIYQVYVRNHTEEGTFQALIKDLSRIKSLGVDMIYLLPVHPIGKLSRKGDLGCPYSIQDYRLINPELGTIDDFKQLIREIHDQKMKIMMDEVFNHTSKDSRLLKEHPEFFYRNKKDIISNRIEDWWDVTDLDFRRDKSLWFELADTLKYYAELGVDGFRMDVASLVPLEFWNYARKIVSRVNRNIIWLSESIHGDFLKYLRDLGYVVSSESEMYQVFDMAYDYDVYPYMEDFLKGNQPLSVYLTAIKKQEEIYPANYVKLKYLENHDIRRIADYVDNDLDKILNWTGFLFFQKGAVMLYAGEEFTSNIQPSLFSKELFNKNVDISDFIKKLIKLKKKKIFSSGIYNVNIPKEDGIAYQSFENEAEKYIGIFNVGLTEGYMSVNISDGTYKNVLNGKNVLVQNQQIRLQKQPIVIRFKK